MKNSLPSSAAIEVRGLAKRFGALQALDGVDLRIEQGEFFGLLGPNGAGKTTLISVLAGLCRPDRGAAWVMGHDVISDYRAARRMLGVVPQELVFDPFFSVRETLRIQSGYFGLRRNDAWIDEILQNLGLEGKASANMRSLSGGMKRRVLVAQALVHKPPVIVLDEPTAGVDVELRQSLWGFIRRLNGEGHTIVLTTHYLEEAEALCNRVALLKAGRVVALDTTAGLIQRFRDQIYLQFSLVRGALPEGLRGRVGEPLVGRYRLRLTQLAEVESILAQVREAGGVIGELAIEQPDLEEVFVQTMRAAAPAPQPA
jgi:ABC-2 type transport system ATP-binding protein